MGKLEEIGSPEKDLERFRAEIKEFIKHCQTNKIDVHIVYRNALKTLAKEDNKDCDDKMICNKRQIIRERRKYLLKTFLIVLAIWMFFGILCAVFSDELNKHSYALVRIAMIKMLPLYDWRPLRKELCLVPITNNEIPHTDPANDCTFCEGIDTIPRMEMYGINENNYFEEVADKIKKFYDIDVPIVLTNVSSSNLNFDIEHLKHDGHYMKYEPCDILTNVRLGKHPTGEEIFDTLEKAPLYFIHWRNCRLDAMKQFRRHFVRPEYLHLNFAPVQQSWVLMGKNYRSVTQNFKHLLLTEPVATIIPIEGFMKVDLSPKHCFADRTCNNHVVDLQRGDALIVSNDWAVSYSYFDPKGETDIDLNDIATNLAIVLETSY